MKVKVTHPGTTVVSGGPSVALGEVVDDGIIDISLPYWVCPDVYRAIEHGICQGMKHGSVNAFGHGGTTSGLYLWELQDE
jgi:hypothetical protein